VKAIMRKVADMWRNLFDIRAGEYRRTVFMSLYLLFVMFAYYVLRTASEAMFLNKFDIDKLPNLYILMAIFGGGLAFAYSKTAARTSLHTAVTWTVFLSVACLLGMWYPLRNRNATTMIWVFAVWVRLFSIVTVTQGWVVASNLFTSREAKRVYGLLGMGMVAGAVFGGEFTTRMVRFIGTNNLLFASIPLVLIAYGCYLIAVAGRTSSVTKAKAAESGEADFSFGDIARDIARSRHIQALMLIMTMQFIVDTLIDYQFKYMAKASFHGDALTAFLGRFYGRYLNGAELILQFFFTTAIVKRLGVGGTLQVMPLSLAGASLFTMASPSVISASLARLVEASTRYTLARTGNELFYMPLPLELRNRIKAFIDIFMDRAARGISGLMLILCIQWSIGVRGIAFLTLCIAIPWVILTVYAHREYVRTIRRRIEARRLDIGSARITVEDADTIRLLEAAAQGTNSRQAAYAISLLAEAPSYDPDPLLLRLADSPYDEVRAQVYELARSRGNGALIDRALAEIQAARSSPATHKAVVYLLSVSPDRVEQARRLLDHPDPAIQEAVVEALTAQPEAPAVLTGEWTSRAAADSDPRRRALAASAVAASGSQKVEIMHGLLADPDPGVAASACRAAGVLKNRAYVPGLVKHLADYRVRSAAIDGLALYGSAVCGTLGDMIDDDSLPLAVRANIPRVLKRIGHQRGVDVLLTCYRHREPAIRAEALKALTRLRQENPSLTFSDPYLKQSILNEAHRYYELLTAAAALKEHRNRARSAVSLLARTLEEHLRQTMDHLFELLSFLYPAREMQGTYLALTRLDRDTHSAAIDFLDSVLDQDLKKVVVPIFDAPERAIERGKALFGVEPHTVESIIGALMHSDEQWIASCAIAAAGELKLRSLAGEVAKAVNRGDPAVRYVATAAAAALV
jgi:ATP/ADP translocase/HEAT repeat protein